jgi:predicted membrane protein
MTATTFSSALSTANRDKFFYPAMAVAMAATVFVGFAPTFFLRTLSDSPPLPPLLHLHGAAFAAWYVILILQATLITRDRPDLHKKLGLAGFGLAAVMVVLGVMAAVHAIRTNHTPPGLDPRSFLVLPFFGVTVFAILAGAGFLLRKRRETHKRLMMLASIAMLDAAIARIPGVFAFGGPLASFGLQDLFVVACIGYDFATRRRVHPAYLVGGLFILAMQPLRIVVSTTPWWLAFGDWLKG